jgi:uncharacterized protein YdeI (YjbR/CyaY-like superfamily)
VEAGVKADASEVLLVRSPRELESWLADHHENSTGIWLKIAKKDSGERTPSYAEALDLALAFGWIDGQKAALDESFFLQRFTPRNARSRWSKINCDKAEALIVAKKMRPAGLAQVDAAKKDGRWDDAYAGQKTATVPDDLAKALAKNNKARLFFETLDRANRYAILYRLGTSTTPDVRAAKIERFVAMLARGERIHERPPKKPPNGRP